MHNDTEDCKMLSNCELNETLSIIFSLNGDDINKELSMSRSIDNSSSVIIDAYIKQHSMPLALRKRLMYQRIVSS